MSNFVIGKETYYAIFMKHISEKKDDTRPFAQGVYHPGSVYTISGVCLNYLALLFHICITISIATYNAIENRIVFNIRINN